MTLEPLTDYSSLKQCEKYHDYIRKFCTLLNPTATV